MAKGMFFSLAETEIIIKNYDKTVLEIMKELEKEGYSRSAKSINRKIEKLREDGELPDGGLRSKSTRNRAYRQRGKVPRTDSEPSLRDGPSFDNSSFGSGFDAYDEE